MPNRIIKESICTSENVDQLTEFQEVFFYRLMVNCDDFGRFDARPKLLSSRLFPLRDISTEKVTETLAALQNAELIVVYEVDGHPYLQMKTWDKHQQGRATKSKYPSFAEGVLQSIDINCNQLQSNDISGDQFPSDDGKCARIRNRIRNTLSDNRNRNTRDEDDEDPLMEDEDAHQIQHDHDRVLDAAEDAGFRMSNNVRASLIALYAEHGLDRVLRRPVSFSTTVSLVMMSPRAWPFSRTMLASALRATRDLPRRSRLRACRLAWSSWRLASSAPSRTLFS